MRKYGQIPLLVQELAGVHSDGPLRSPLQLAQLATGVEYALARRRMHAFNRRIHQHLAGLHEMPNGLA